MKYLKLALGIAALLTALYFLLELLGPLARMTA